ncbi:MAG: GH3 auxin-responsive promoter family protein [Bacteroidetes bacterium]|nr:GH3 auxin-responsive promoter family protein [Bacteroidota bacterium]
MPFNSIFGWLMQKRVHQIELFKKYPIEVQQEIFSKLLYNGKYTDYGQLNGFNKVDSIRDFQTQVPLQTYDEVKPWVDRLLRGEKALLWPTDTKMFAKSSGTTSDRSKYIPVTRESIEDCHQKGGKDLLALYYNQNPEGKLYSYKHLVVGGSCKSLTTDSDVVTGDLSALIMKTMPWWAEIKRTPTKETALMDEWEEKIARMAIEASQEDVGLIVGVPSWTLVLMRRILEITGANYIDEIWPNVECFMHGGVSFLPYKDQFKALIQKKEMRFMESYNASEGFFGIQDVLGKDDLLLMLDYGIFYEFIPIEHFKGVESNYVVNLSDVEVGKTYAMVISTNGGLWRYIVGDTVEFTEKYPFRFRINGRTKSFMNAFGEELIVDNADRAVQAACSQTNALLRDYSACPIYMENSKKGGHEWLFEFDREPDSIEKFAEILDNHLRLINSDYDAKRSKDLAVLAPKLTVLPIGTFEAWLKAKGKLGGQHKVPRLNNDRKILEQIMQEIRL